jgi:alginate O-acetyltransferase complex protein AlgI
MVFSSLIFLYRFLPICILLYYIMPSIKLKNYVLVGMSLIFYAWGEPVFVLLLIASACANFFFGKLVGKQDERSKLWFILSVVFNLGLLVVFKYTDFLIGTVNGVLGTAIPLTGIALPIGISFYTFQTLSYVIDVRRGKVPVQESFVDFLLFVSLFPQLIAGPILRYEEIAPQLKRRRIHSEDAFYGVTRFCIGLGKKVLIANYTGSVASQLLDGTMSSQTTVGVWLGVVMFSLQIYFDFSGYSDMAIGLGRMFGFHYGENFDLPYQSKSATEFWRRWHISLGSFFRDYVYIPLGGNRKHQMLNLLVVWFLTGLWHGASWNFVLWGLYFGALIVAEKYTMDKLEKIPAAVRHIVMIFVILFGWTLFYFTDFSQLRAALGVMFGGGAGFLDAKTKIQLTNNLLLLIVGVLGSTALPRTVGLRFTALCTAKNQRVWNIAFLAVVFAFDLGLLLLSTVSLVGSSFNPFLYFRF